LQGKGFEKGEGTIFHLDCAELPTGDLFTRAYTAQQAYEFFMQYIGTSVQANLREADDETKEDYEGFPKLEFAEVIEEH